MNIRLMSFHKISYEYKMLITFINNFKQNIISIKLFNLKYWHKRVQFEILTQTCPICNIGTNVGVQFATNMLTLLVYKIVFFYCTIEIITQYILVEVLLHLTLSNVYSREIITLYSNILPS